MPISNSSASATFSWVLNTATPNIRKFVQCTLCPDKR